MIRRSTARLRLHVEEAPRQKRTAAAEIHGMQRVSDSFRRLTGWALRCHTDGARPSQPIWSREIAEVDGQPPCIVSINAANDPVEEGRPLQSNRIDSEAAQQLAAGIADLLEELLQSQAALGEREAELAIRVPVTSHPDEPAHLAERLESVLKACSHAVGCQAAAVYLLDESTRTLKLRACWGLPKSRFAAPPRPLRGAAADLEALVGHAVIVREAERLPSWQIPEEFHAAVCVPISSPTTPFGTLWVFSESRRDFTVDETNIVEIVAGRIASDLERAMLLSQTAQLRSLARQLTHAAQWQQHRLPRIKPLLRGWEVDGWTMQAGALGGDFHDWFVGAGGKLAVAVGDAQGKMFESGLTTATLHTALRAHAAYGHTAQQVAERVNETLWTASVGDQFASLFYAQIQPETGAIEYVGAGHVYAAIVGDSLRTLAPTDALPLGTQPDGDYATVSDRLERGEILAVVSEGVHHALRRHRHQILWRVLQSHRESNTDDLLHKTRAFLDRHATSRATDDQTILLVKRTSTP